MIVIMIIRHSIARTSAIRSICVLLLVVGVFLTLPVVAEPPTEDALKGAWYGEPMFDGHRGHFGLRIQCDARGRLIGMLSMLDIDVRDLPIGIVSVEPGRVTIGPLAVDYDQAAGTLSGTIPEELAPVHAIRFTLRKIPEFPASIDKAPEAPAATPRWTFDAGSPIWGGVAVSHGRLFFGTVDGDVIALDTESGRRVWRFGTGGAVRSRPEVTGNDLFVVSDDGFAYRLAAADGALRWKSRVGAPTTRSPPGDPSYAYDSYASTPALWMTTLLVGSGNDVVALDAGNGKERWRYTTGGAVSTKPAIAGGLAFVGSFDGKLHAVDAQSGKLVWTHDFGAPVMSSPAVVDGHVIVGSRSYDLKALQARGGEVVWSYYDWFSWVESSPTIVDGAVYIGSSDAQKLRSFDAASGKPSWSFDTGGSAWAQPAVTRDRVYIGSVGVADYLIDHQATFWSVDRKSGKPVWRFDLLAPEESAIWGFAASPAADETSVYAATLAGGVYAFAR